MRTYEGRRLNRRSAFGSPGPGSRQVPPSVVPIWLRGLPPRPAGTYFITTDIRPLGAVLSRKGDGFAFCRALPEQAGVVAIPNAVFYDHRDAGAPFVRFAFCKQTAVLEDAAERLRKAFTR